MRRNGRDDVVSEAQTTPDGANDPVRSAIDPTKRLTPQIVRHVRDMIMSGEAPGNTALRTEHLAARFGVSATPVREALMSLSGEGLVELRPGRGFRVVQM